MSLSNFCKISTCRAKIPDKFSSPLLIYPAHRCAIICHKRSLVPKEALCGAASNHTLREHSRANCQNSSLELRFPIDHNGVVVIHLHLSKHFSPTKNLN